MTPAKNKDTAIHALNATDSVTALPRPVLITGASSGIGLELARIYARAGKPLVLVARNKARLAGAAAELSSLNPLYAKKPEFISTLSLDVADAKSVNAKLAECVQTCGVPQLVINAAGVVNVGRFLEMEPSYFDDNLRIDFDGTVNVCRALAPDLVAAGSGHMVNIASVAGFLGIYGYTGYSAAKFAVMGFSEALRFEMKPLGVDVSVVCPPDTLTPGFETEKAHRPAETEAIAGNVPALKPELVAQKIAKEIERKRFYIIIGASSKFYFRLKGLLPEIFLALVDSDVRKVGKKRAELSSAPKQGSLQTVSLRDILTPSAYLPEQRVNRGGIPPTSFALRSQ